MARGSKAKHTSKQKRQARNIEDSAKKRGYAPQRAAQIGYATVNKQESGGKNGGSGRGRTASKSSSRRGGRRSHKGTSR